MVWITLTDIGIQPEKGFGIHELQLTSKGFRSKVFTTRLPVSGFIQSGEIGSPG